jgi:mannitol/fructose-specific phosphotransferase system IIA component (Ntr-type)
MLSQVQADLMSFIRLKNKIETAQNDSEREDLLVQLAALRAERMSISVLCSLSDIQSRFPLLFPLLALSIGLKIAFF